MARKSRDDKFVEERVPAPIRPLTAKQAEYINAIMTSEMVTVMGPAGTGKTYVAATIAADLLRARHIHRIVLTRPNVASGRSLGFFPGTLEEKIGPWVVPFTDVIRQRMGEGAFEVALKKGDIDIVPFEVMRGRTFNNSFIILDEAQNTTIPEIKMFLTRLGKDSTTIINGDVAQTDLRETSGLSKVIQMAKRHMLPVPVIEFGVEDIVRSDLCAMWVKAFLKEGL
jgi:phosphate starvation-inducible PhoH-like protein